MKPRQTVHCFIWPMSDILLLTFRRLQSYTQPHRGLANQHTRSHPWFSFHSQFVFYPIGHQDTDSYWVFRWFKWISIYYLWSSSIAFQLIFFCDFSCRCVPENVPNWGFKVRSQLWAFPPIISPFICSENWFLRGGDFIRSAFPLLCTISFSLDYLKNLTHLPNSCP